MPLPTPYEESPTTTLPVPCPTHPVAGRAVDSEDPVFDWTPVPDAPRYRVQIAENEAFDDPYYDDHTERSTALSLRAVLPDDVDSVCWRVRAEKGESARSPWSDAARFARPSSEPTEEEATVRVDAPPVPHHPDDRTDAPVDRSAVPFAWEGIPEASGYQLQVAPDEDFTDPSVDLTLDQTTSVTLCDMLPEEASPLYWRLRPLFRVAAPGPWSEPVSFEMSSSSTATEGLAPEGEAPESYARAAGPVEHARTSLAFSLTVSLVAVLSFIATIFLIALAG